MDAFFRGARAMLNAATRLTLVLAVAVMTLAVAETQAQAEPGESASGAGSVFGTYSFSFSATGLGGFSATGTMTYFIPVSGFNATASVRCLLAAGTEAILVGTVTSSTSSAYVGADMIFEVVDNATPGVNADEWTFDFGPTTSCDQYTSRFPAMGAAIGAGEITVVSATPEQFIAELVTELRAVPAGPGESYLSKLEAIVAKLADGKAAAACNQLDALANEIQAQRGKTLTDAQADHLMERVVFIKLKAGCA